MFPKVKPYHLLVIEDNPGDYILLEEYLKLSQLPIDKIVHADSLKSVPFLIKENVIDLALLDLTLPDSNGVDSVITLGQLIPQTPIIVLSGLSTIAIAVESISLGAQDYLMKGEFNEKLLAKSIQYSIERKKTTEILRQSNERYEFVNKATQDTIWEWDYHTKEGRFGEGIIKIFGYSEAERKYNENWLIQFIHPDDKGKVSKKILSHLEKGLQNWQHEYRFRCADGTYKEVFDRGFIIYDLKGEPVKMYGAITDITNQRKLEKALVEQKLFQQKLITETAIDTQENERGMLGRELHDNINQILAAAKMFIGMAKAGKGNTPELIENSFKLVDSAMEEIRKLSKTLVAPSLGEIGLKEALEELIDEINITAPTYFQLEYKSKRNVDKKIELMVYRIVQEQINNILKYAKAKEALINIDTEENRLFLSIADNGVGFSPEIKSTGIGMKNIKSRIEFYSGNLIIISSPGNGCALKAEVPL